jgi:molybdopterin molybdotransferase
MLLAFVTDCTQETAGMNGQNKDLNAPAAKPRTLSVAEAQQAILDAMTPTAGWERVAIRSGLGRVLAEDVIAPYDVPAHDNSAMDGYALRLDDLAADRPTTLNVVGTAFAGRAFSGLVGPGQAVRVMTGAVLPQGADCVVPQEDVQAARAASEETAATVTIPAGQQRNQHIRRAGEDLARGKPALTAGKWLGPAEIGLLASLGFAEVPVRCRLRVAFFSTGDEIASIGQTLSPGEIYDSNRYTLWSGLTRLGVDVLDLGVVRDEPAALEAALRTAASQADVIITTGGVSVGEADFIKTLMARLGQVNFWKINLKPGRPMAFGKVGDAFLFGLPGNPVATMVAFHQFVADALRKLMGVSPLPPRPTFRAPCLSAIKKTPGRREFPRGVLLQDGGEWRVKLAGSQGSGVLRSMSEANCYIVLPETQGSVAVGDLVEVQMFEGIL